MSLNVNGYTLQEKPLIVCASIPGDWLISHATPSWRLDDPEKGFQRVVSEKRALQIAKTVLDYGRTFPNAIVLATDKNDLRIQDGIVTLPTKIKFLVVDGQHRLWAQKFSENIANYACMIHMGLSEEEMASLFIEINDNQKRVPPSLRWDLVRLVRPEEEPNTIRAADLVYYLATEDRSPLYQRIDLTGETPALRIKQASLAPEIKGIVGKAPLKEVGYDIQASVLIAFFEALRDRDPQPWHEGSSVLCMNRVLRVLIKLLPKLLGQIEKSPGQIIASDFSPFLSNLDLETLDPEKIRGQQGSAGMSQIQATIEGQMGV